MFDFRILGTRGTTTVCSAAFLKYGGSTTSFRIKTSSGIIAIDAGTGISRLANEISGLGEELPITMLFTHFHLDHLTGLPSFNPLYNKNANIVIMADAGRKENWKDSITTLMDKPYWPVGIGEVGAAIEMKDLPSDANSMNIYGVNVSWQRVPHPQQCLAFKISDKDKTIVIATDVEYTKESVTDEFIDFCTGCDALIYDAQFTQEEYDKHVGWGHSSWNTAVYIANKAKVKQLLLTHHDPERNDAQIDRIIDDARKLFANTNAATEGLNL